VLRRRREWFERLEAPAAALWWVPDGRISSVAEAKWRLDLVATHGATARAFTFTGPFAIGAETESGPSGGVWLPCGAT
jgi:hypothetical protein